MSAPVGVVMARAAELAARHAAVKVTRKRNARARAADPTAIKSPQGCVYCGRGTKRVCGSHADLPKIDVGFPPVSPLNKAGLVARSPQESATSPNHEGV